ncbi:DUF3718 domain-containing protein [Paraglaciecola hydrolytica]|uniref:DUF3718 domain-containing protein n=1 Tax=Paraglaciecola hydrolytica TaxID=1799789 RepID=A0A136A1I1_9ALTE|nr:DUF3718 domain-containing protein [Paraglaciecola hydrolytica]KXI29089.1 hypothetical protein AX660_13070 [Paraglaciecola hydrolytica]
MKTLPLTVLAISFGLLATSAQAHFDQSVNDQVCDIVKTHDKVKLNQTVKSIQLSMNTLYNNVKCEGQNILQFSINQGAEQVSEYVIKKTSSKYLAKDVELYNSFSPELAQSDIMKSLQAKINS